jgi:catechol 2,3-dioxygenase-like lactoylglutathione lyase family enzyme
MKTRGLILSLVLLLPFARSWSQVSAPNEAGVAMGHVHLNVRDVDANRKFWTELGGTATKLDETTVMKFPGILIFLTPAAASGDNEGAIVNHIGFYLQDFDKSVAQWQAVGIKMTDLVRRPARKAAYVYSPDNLKVEIAQNADTPPLPSSIVNDHMHYYLGATAGPELLAWYAKMFGAQVIAGTPPQNATLPGVRLRLSATDEATFPTKGRVLDHIGFEVKNLEAFCKKLQANGVKFDQPYSKSRHRGYASAMLTDPWGTSIELTEGLSGL